MGSAVLERREGPPGRWETLLGALLIVAATAPGMLLLGVSEDPGAPENPIFRLYWLPVYALTVGLSLWRWKAVGRAWPAIGLCTVLVAWAFASKSWSILPDVTGRRAVALLMTTLIGVYLAAASPPARMVKMLASGFAVLAIGSLVVALTMKRIGVEHEPTLAGDWRGLWSTKNALAEFMMLGALAGVSAAVLSPGRRILWIGAAGTCFALLLMSRGKTALLCLILGLAVIGALGLMRRGPASAVVTSFMAGSALLWGGFLAVANPTALLTALGKDPTLTGRTDIWAAILRQIDASPLLGFGFGAFWEKTSDPANFIRKQTHWKVPSAHNGWLDLWVQVGAIGVVLFAAALGVTLVALALRAHRLKDGYFCLAFMLVFLTLSMSESVLEQHNNLPWSLFVAVMTYALLPERVRQASPAAIRYRPGLRQGAAAIDTGA